MAVFILGISLWESLRQCLRQVGPYTTKAASPVVYGRWTYIVIDLSA